MVVSIKTGKMVATAALSKETFANPKFCEFVNKSISRHIKGDWGDLEEEDKLMNDDSLSNGGRLHSAYDIPSDIQIPNETKIWIITEWDASATTILFPSEY